MAGFLHADQDQFWKKLKSETKCLSKFQSESSSFLVWKIIQLSPEGDVNIDRDAKRRGRYLALFTDPEGDSCFSIYQISWIKLKKVTFGNQKRHLVGTLFTMYKHFGDFFQLHLYDFVANSAWKSFSTYQSTLTSQRSSLFVCTTASFIAQSSSFENVSERDAILTSVAEQWIAKDIQSYGSQTKRAKTAIHFFGKYWRVIAQQEGGKGDKENWSP